MHPRPRSIPVRTGANRPEHCRQRQSPRSSLDFRGAFRLGYASGRPGRVIIRAPAVRADLIEQRRGLDTPERARRAATRRYSMVGDKIAIGSVEIISLVDVEESDHPLTSGPYLPRGTHGGLGAVPPALPRCLRRPQRLASPDGGLPAAVTGAHDPGRAPASARLARWWGRAHRTRSWCSRRPTCWRICRPRASAPKTSIWWSSPICTRITSAGISWESGRSAPPHLPPGPLPRPSGRLGGVRAGGQGASRGWSRPSRPSSHWACWS